MITVEVYISIFCKFWCQKCIPKALLYMQLLLRLLDELSVSTGDIRWKEEGGEGANVMLYAEMAATIGFEGFSSFKKQTS